MAYPFGLKMGMSISEIAGLCEEEPTFIEDDIYYITPLKSHPLFAYYAAYVHPENGLYKIRAISYQIKSNKYGQEIKETFNSIKDKIQLSYGKARLIDECKKTTDNYHLKEEYWFYLLQNGSRKLQAVWNKKNGLEKDLVLITLDASVTQGVYEGTTQLILHYHFKNSYEVEAIENSVF